MEIWPRGNPNSFKLRKTGYLFLFGAFSTLGNKIINDHKDMLCVFRGNLDGQPQHTSIQYLGCSGLCDAAISR